MRLNGYMGAIIFMEDIVEKLKSDDKEVIFEAAEILNNIFDSYYKWNEQDYIAVMNAVILKCTLPEINEDRKIFEKLLDVLEIGGGKIITDSVNYDPLIEVFNNERNFDIFDQLVIILGFSYQPKYIDYLNSIKTDSSFLQKEINDAIFELKYFKR